MTAINVHNALPVLRSRIFEVGDGCNEVVLDGLLLQAVPPLPLSWSGEMRIARKEGC
jgi:hypothetical protein